MRKIKQLSEEPWGVPKSTPRGSESAAPICTDCVLWLRYDSNHFRVVWSRPSNLDFSSSILVSCCRNFGKSGLACSYVEFLWTNLWSEMRRILWAHYPRTEMLHFHVKLTFDFCLHWSWVRLREFWLKFCVKMLEIWPQKWHFSRNAQGVGREFVLIGTVHITKSVNITKSVIHCT